MCRERGDTKAVGSINYSEPSRTEWVFAYENLTANADKSGFLAAVKAAIPNAPQHIKKIKIEGPGSLHAALNLSATFPNDGLATTGPWSERVGKDVFRYEIGVADASAQNAINNRTAHNLS